MEKKKKAEKPKAPNTNKEAGGQEKKTSNFKISISFISGLIFCFLFVVDVFAAQTKRIIIPAYKLYVLPIHKHIYVSTMKLVHYNGISRSFLEKRYPGLDLNILDDLKSGERHPSVWLEGIIFRGKRNVLDINILQIMTTSKNFPNTIELKYDARNRPWFLQRLRTFQFLMTKEAVQTGRLKIKPFESYPVNLHLEVSNLLWKNGFRGENSAVTFTNRNVEINTIKDETDEEIFCTPHLANICTEVSNNLEELEEDIRTNGVVVVKNLLSEIISND